MPGLLKRFARRTRPPVASEERVADFLIALETVTYSRFSLTPVALRGMDGITRATVMVRLDDFATGLSPDEARLAAECLRADEARPIDHVHADLLITAAEDAERRLTEDAATHDGGVVVTLEPRVIEPRKGEAA